MYNLSHSNGMSLKTLSRICEFFDYELVVRPKSDADREAKIIILESEQSKDINGSLIVKDDEFQRSQRSTEKDEMLKLFESLTEEQQAAILVTIKAMLK